MGKGHSQVDLSACVRRMPEGVYVVDRHDRVTYANRSFRDMLGYSKEAMAWLRRSEFEVGADRLGDVRKRAGRTGTFRKDTSYERRDSSVVPVSVTAFRTHDRGTTCFCVHDASDDGACAAARLREELEERDRAQERLEEENARLGRLVSLDFLTGSGSRASFFDEAERAIERAREEAVPLSFLMIDIDFFKRVNDDFGHQFGDATLVRMADVITESVRDTDFLARWGGEEFFIILPGTPSDGAMSLARRLCECVRTSDFGIGEPLTVSIGVTEYVEPDTTDSLVRRADEALYNAKGTGRDRAILVRG